MDRASAGGQRGLAHPGHVLDEQVPAREEADDGEPHHLRLADQRAPDVLLETADPVGGPGIRGHLDRAAQRKAGATSAMKRSSVFLLSAGRKKVGMNSMPTPASRSAPACP